MPADMAFAVAELQTRVFSALEFNQVLSGVIAGDQALQAVSFTVEGGYGTGAKLGAGGAGTPTSTETELVGDRTVQLVVWRDMSSAGSVTSSDLWAMFKAFWRADERSPSAGILSGQYGAMRAALQGSVDAWAAGHVAVAFADIDRFKQFNDRNGWEAGNGLIRAVGQALAAAAPPSCVVVHLSGDEFLVFATGDRAHEALGVCLALRTAAEAALLDAEQAGGGTRATGLSMGIASYARGDVDGTDLFELLRDRAEKAMKPDGAKRYGVVSVSPGPAAPPADAADADGLAVVLTAARLSRPVPFGNSWLNVLADAAQTAASHDLGDGLAPALQRAVEGLVVPADRAQAHESLRPPQDVLNGGLPLAPLEIVLAAACGVARAALTGRSGPTSVDVAWTEAGAQLSVAGAPVLAVGAPLAEPRTTVLLREGHAQGAPAATTRALLVTVGSGGDAFPADLFAGVVYVDDKPSVGGGLPDLWEAALAQVVDTASENPNVGRVFIIGNIEHAEHTLRLLEAPQDWDAAADTLAYKLGTGTARIRDVGRRLTGAARQVTALDEIVAELLAHQESAPPVAALVDDPRVRTVPRALRNAAVPETYRLQTWDGCRVQTAFQAFPVALHLLRHSNAPRLQDQNQRAYLELSDFRIVLENPLTDPVPAFYLLEKESLEAYYQAQFASADGLFRAALDADGQLAAVIEHVAGAMTRGTSTRRAVLVIPHRLPDDGGLSPLGLVSVRLVPRLRDDGSLLDASFSWRTVEALVGLPYSLYGSIRFAQELAAHIAARLPTAMARTMRTGTISFIAQSLHLFTDPYAQRIARQVIAEETE